jgi:hypothetical protein
VVLAVEGQRPAVREGHLDLGLFAGLDVLVDLELVDRQVVLAAALVLQLERHALAGLALQDGGLEVVVVELDLDLALA